MTLNHRYPAFFMALAVALTMAGCAGQFRPADQPEAIGYVQEKLDTALTGISTAYQTGLIDQDEKNQWLDRWQRVKDLSDWAITAYARGSGSSFLDQARTQVRIMLVELVRAGVLKRGDED